MIKGVIDASSCEAQSWKEVITWSSLRLSFPSCHDFPRFGCSYCDLQPR